MGRLASRVGGWGLPGGMAGQMGGRAGSGAGLAVAGQVVQRGWIFRIKNVLE